MDIIHSYVTFLGCLNNLSHNFYRVSNISLKSITHQRGKKKRKLLRYVDSGPDLSDEGSVFALGIKKTGSRDPIGLKKNEGPQNKTESKRVWCAHNISILISQPVKFSQPASIIKVPTFFKVFLASGATSY